MNRIDQEYGHSVALDKDKCKGCTTCIAHCPTEAIRVRKGRARIMTDRCIDCGACIRVCPYHAKISLADSLKDLYLYDYRVAIPAPTLYGQFKSKISINKILTALKRLGFDEVFEAARAAEIVSGKMREIIKDPSTPKPVISSSCPAVVRLIQVRFPSLIDHIAPVESPMEIAARIIRQDIHKDKKNLGIFFISPCPAKVTSVRSPMGSKTSAVDRVIPIRDLCLPMLSEISGITDPESLCHSSGVGIGWARSEGESNAIDCFNRIAVDGIDNVVALLDELESGKMRNVDFIEADACPGGCVGGALTVENPYLARGRVKKKITGVRKEPESYSHPEGSKVELMMTEQIQPKQILKLDDDFSAAMEKMEKVESLTESLPGLDCGACGAPTCRALAEDIVQNRAEKTDCIFVLRENIRHLAAEMVQLEAKMPPALDRDETEE